MAKRGKVKRVQQAVVATVKSKVYSGNGEDKSQPIVTKPGKDDGNGKNAIIVEEPEHTKEFDGMPDIVDDPANVFRMVVLEMRRVALENKRKFIELHYTTQMAALQKKMTNSILEMDTEIEELKRQHKEQKDFIEEKHGIALRAYTYNDETGILTKHDFGEEEMING